MVSRKGLFVGASSAFATIGIARFPAGAAEFNWKFAHDDPPTQPSSILIAEAVNRIKSDSNGRLDIQIFGNSQLGGDQAMISQLRLGAIQLLNEAYAVLGQVSPACTVDALPFVFTDYKQAYVARDGAWGAYMRGTLAKAGLYAFQRSWEQGFRQIFNSVRPINVPDDLKGLKLRVPESKPYVALFKAFGAAPTPLEMANEYTSLQSHLVDGAEQPLGIIFNMKFYEVVKYLSVTNHASTGHTILANGAAWSSLPKNLQDIVERHIDEAGEKQRDGVVKADADMQQGLAAKGLAVNKADNAAFKTAVRKAGLYAQWRDEFGTETWSSLERSVGALA